MSVLLMIGVSLLEVGVLLVGYGLSMIIEPIQTEVALGWLKKA